MATTIKTKNSTTAATAPTGLVQGELAVNITDKKLYVGDASGNSIQIAGQGATNGAGGSNTQVQYNSSGALAGSANLTFDGSQLSVYGITVGRGAGAVSSNTVTGNGAGASNSTGAALALFGYRAGNANTADYTSAFGCDALELNTSGVSNSGFGAATLYSNTTGSYNSAFGKDALRNNTTASNNTAVGYQAGYSNTTGLANTIVGYQAGYYANGGTNTYLGYSAGYGDATGISNTYLGYGAGSNGVTNASGSENTSVGRASLTSVTTANYNTAVGYQAGYSLTTSSYNVFLGHKAGFSTTTSAGYSVAVGRAALYNQTTGTENTAIGQYALNAVTTGINNQVIGTGSGSLITTGSKNSILGSYNGNQGGLDIRTASNYIVLSDGDGNPNAYCDANKNWTMTGAGLTGSLLILNATNASGYGTLAFNNNGSYASQVYNQNSTGRLYAQSGASGGVYLAPNATSWTSASDERVKENLVSIENAANKVATLRAVTGNYIADETKKSRAFLIAQDVQAVLPEAVDATNPDELGVQYTDVIPLLVAAIKELKAEIDLLKGVK